MSQDSSSAEQNGKPSAPFLLYAPNAEPGCLTFGPTSEAPYKADLITSGSPPTVSLKFGVSFYGGVVHRQAGLEACLNFPVITFNFIEVTLNDKID